MLYTSRAMDATPSRLGLDRLLGLLRPRWRGEQTAQSIVERDRLVDRLLRRLGLVRLAHVERIADGPEVTEGMVSAAFWLLVEFSHETGDPERRLVQIWEAMEAARMRSGVSSMRA